MIKVRKLTIRGLILVISLMGLIIRPIDTAQAEDVNFSLLNPGQNKSVYWDGEYELTFEVTGKSFSELDSCWDLFRIDFSPIFAIRNLKKETAVLTVGYASSGSYRIGSYGTTFYKTKLVPNGLQCSTTVNPKNTNDHYGFFTKPTFREVEILDKIYGKGDYPNSVITDASELLFGYQYKNVNFFAGKIPIKESGLPEIQFVGLAENEFIRYQKNYAVKISYQETLDSTINVVIQGCKVGSASKTKVGQKIEAVYQCTIQPNESDLITGQIIQRVFAEVRTGIATSRRVVIPIASGSPFLETNLSLRHAKSSTFKKPQVTVDVYVDFGIRNLKPSSMEPTELIICINRICETLKYDNAPKDGFYKYTTTVNKLEVDASVSWKYDKEGVLTQEISKSIARKNKPQPVVKINSPTTLRITGPDRLQAGKSYPATIRYSGRGSYTCSVSYALNANSLFNDYSVGSFTGAGSMSKQIQVPLRGIPDSFMRVSVKCGTKVANKVFFLAR